ncbi:hypothetical protein G6F46_006292 [Rhizopus delemar]|uniref:ELMO domain-containing protein n=2 Tax=Rhizopus TaxID=4842 RepID=A0A9P7CR21_9FUNG|nr:hypothetical protein G6F43_007023 [Rhizopus delemar]KAG1543809.1 hypothetical protein G6F51_006450 [Rhizopus arrhizus]KAG1461758.1 hypothetical protein G6F55_003381 [Rhizopus delemar]KAG1497711.1 hypothetical protein G6F54_005578 [Rhizopus delemar]KAG1512097.1 hypothetical protein G6F53_005443 [Rhizopus delemar]
MLLYRISQSVSTPYDINNKEHEDKLLELWNKMMPNTPLESRISKQWVDIGFQGNDPATDFRGMGIQGLNDLLYFVNHYPDQVHSILQHASHPVYWYPYAIVGINITRFAYRLLESKKLQMYLFKYGLAYEEFYCYLFYHFNRFWSSFSVIEFEQRFIEFQGVVEKDLIQQNVKPLNTYNKEYTNIQ